MQSDQKTLNQMNRLGDMLHFPAAVNAGASLNIVITIAITWQIASRWPAWVGPWVALVLAVNLLPVALLRLTLSADTVYPTLSGMNFFRDQHKFSDWVYVAASANMAFWILLTWTLVRLYPAPVVFISLEMVALLVTFSPVLFRRFLGD
jgi:hypothetical protein